MEWLAAAVCGFLSGLGIGGGSLLMVWMTAVSGLQQAAAQSINLLYFLPTAGISLLFHSKNRFVDWKKSCWAIIGGVLMAAVGAWLSSRIDTQLLKTLFGYFLILVGINEFRTAKQN